MDISDYVKEIEQIKQELRLHDKRLSDIEGDRKLQLFQYESIMECMSELKIDVKEIKERPLRKWDIIITGIITACIGYFMATILK